MDNDGGENVKKSKIKKEKEEENIKEFAESTMNELLGWYGYGASRDERKAVSTYYNSNSNSSDNSSPKLSEGCGWCGKAVEENTGISSAAATFCSELCFSQSRRANFKKNKTCDWCRHVRYTVSYVDFQDGASQLQFCSDKCLNQYKMHIFCRETRAHLEMHPHLIAEDSETGLITPELWLKNCKSPESHPSSPRSSPKRDHPQPSPVPLLTVAHPSKLLASPEQDPNKHKNNKLVRRNRKRCPSTITCNDFGKSPQESPQDLRVRPQENSIQKDLPKIPGFPEGERPYLDGAAFPERSYQGKGFPDGLQNHVFPDRESLQGKLPERSFLSVKGDGVLQEKLFAERNNLSERNNFPGKTIMLKGNAMLQKAFQKESSLQAEFPFDKGLHGSAFREVKIQDGIYRKGLMANSHLRKPSLLESSLRRMPVQESGELNPGINQHDSNMNQHDSDVNRHDSNMNQRDSNINRHDPNMNLNDSNVNEHDSNINQHDSNMNQHDSNINQHDSNERHSPYSDGAPEPQYSNQPGNPLFPPVTVLVPYPILLPVPFPVPIPLPISSFLAAAKLSDGNQDAMDCSIQKNETSQEEEEPKKPVDKINEDGKEDHLEEVISVDAITDALMNSGKQTRKRKRVVEPKSKIIVKAKNPLSV